MKAQGQVPKSELPVEQLPKKDSPEIRDIGRRLFGGIRPYGDGERGGL